MRLADLLADLPVAVVEGEPSVEITGVAYDSREVTPGALFVALRGGYTDGHRYVGEAVGRGAAAALVEQMVEAPGLAAQVVVADTRRRSPAWRPASRLPRANSA